MSQDDFTIQIELPSTHRFLNVVSLGIDAIFQRLEDLVFDTEKISFELQVATQEICANIVEHAYPDNEDGRLSIAISVQPEESKLYIHIRDSGKEFDIRTVSEPDLGHLQEKGFGLFFAKQLMDNVSYARKDGENHWRLVKHFDYACAASKCEQH